MPGTNISAAEVTHVSIHGFWLLLGDEELLLPFSEFPWFRQATIEQLTTIEWPSPRSSRRRHQRRALELQWQTVDRAGGG